MQLPGPNTNKTDSAGYTLLKGAGTGEAAEEKFGLFEVLSLRARAGFCDALAVGSLSMAALSPFLNGLDQNQVFYWAAFAFGLGFFDCLFSFGPIIVVITYFWALFRMESILFLIQAAACAFAVNAIYHIVFESSKLSGTPGKLLNGLKVCRADGRPLSIVRASLRHALKAVNLAAVIFPVLLIWKCNRRQLAHDCLTSSYVLPAVEVKTRAVVVSETEAAGPPQVTWEHTKEESIVAKAPVNPFGDANVEYPSLLRRALASLLDGILFYSIESAVYITLAALVSNWMSPSTGLMDWQMVTFIVTLVVVVTSFTVPITMLVFAGFESSRLAATPGKIALGLKVTSLTGQRLTFWPALVKQVVQGLTYMSLCPLFCLIFLGVTAAKLGDHVKIAALCFFLFYLVYGALLCVTLAGGKQTVIDKLSHRFVIKESTSTELKRIIT